jgi:hypothetical protein
VDYSAVWECELFFLSNSTTFASPSASGTVGSHPSSSRARVILLARCRRENRELPICDKGYAGRAFAGAAAALGVVVARPARKDEPGHGPHLAPIHQRIESIFLTSKDLLTLERHGARTLAGLRERFLCLAACISLNHQLGRPSRALVDYCA